LTIDWAHFTPEASLAGGLLIGFAAVMLILLNGRIAGISGILGGLLQRAKGETGWRIAFLFGLIVAPAIFAIFKPLPDVTVDARTLTLVAGGLLVGIGTRYGSGCTSGHGVCGLSRLSFRSLVATLTFMLAGFATVFAVRHLLGN
jgi:uncharacterized membrane protein YedE/YeeE